MARTASRQLSRMLREHRPILFALTALFVFCSVLLVWRLLTRAAPSPTLQEAFPAGEMRVGVDTSFAPFAMDTGGTLIGLDIDLAQAIADEMGIPVRFVPLGFDGLYDALITGQIDVLISALVVNPARMDEVRYARHYFDNGLLLIDEADTDIAQIQDIPDHSIAFEFGSIANAQVRAWSRRLPAFETQPYELPHYALDAVRLGQADVALVNGTAYHLYRREHPEWQPEIHPYSNTFYAPAVRLDREATWIWINAIMNTLHRDGRLDAIVARWL